MKRPSDGKCGANERPSKATKAGTILSSIDELALANARIQELKDQVGELQDLVIRSGLSSRWSLSDLALKGKR